MFGPAGYRQVRAGTNGFTCMVNRDGNQDGDNDLKPTCWDPEGSRAILPVMLRVGELIARGATSAEIKADIDAGFAAGRFAAPRKTGIAYMLRGELIYDPKTGQTVKTNPPAHYMIYAPGVSGADIGIPRPQPATPYALPMVWSGYSGAPHTTYIIVPAAAGAGHAH